MKPIHMIPSFPSSPLPLSPPPSVANISPMVKPASSIESISLILFRVGTHFRCHFSLFRPRVGMKSNELVYICLHNQTQSQHSILNQQALSSLASNVMNLRRDILYLKLLLALFAITLFKLIYYRCFYTDLSWRNWPECTSLNTVISPHLVDYLFDWWPHFGRSISCTIFVPFLRPSFGRLSLAISLCLSPFGHCAHRARHWICLESNWCISPTSELVAFGWTSTTIYITCLPLSTLLSQRASLNQNHSQALVCCVLDSYLTIIIIIIINVLIQFDYCLFSVLIFCRLFIISYYFVIIYYCICVLSLCLLLPLSSTLLSFSILLHLSVYISVALCKCINHIFHNTWPFEWRRDSVDSLQVHPNRWLYLLQYLFGAGAGTHSCAKPTVDALCFYCRNGASTGRWQL